MIKFRVRCVDGDLKIVVSLTIPSERFSQTIGVNPRAPTEDISLFEYINGEHFQITSYNFQEIIYARDLYDRSEVGPALFADGTRIHRFIEECRVYTKRFDGGCT